MITAENVMDAILEYIKESFNSSMKAQSAYEGFGITNMMGLAHRDDDEDTSAADALRNKREHAVVMLDAFVDAKAEIKASEMLVEFKNQIARRAPVRKAGYHPLYDEE